MALMAITRLADPVNPLRSILVITGSIAEIAAIWFMLLSFRNPELPGTRQDP